MGDYSFQTCLNMMAFDAVFYFVLAWYVEQVMPKQFGVRRPVLFLFYPSYWRSFFPNSHLGYGSLGSEEVGAGENEEAVATGMEARVVIKSLVKQYAGAERRAVDELSLSMYENQITCLLGHNGGEIGRGAKHRQCTSSLPLHDSHARSSQPERPQRSPS